jgi:sec-independent protein translocase protein TatA
MGLSTTHLLILVAVVVLLFGRNKISDLMGDVGKGIKSFKKGIADDSNPEIVKRDGAKQASQDGAA